MILEGITKRYGERTALQDVNLELKDGEITAVLGESGAGKTTLLNVIAGLTSYEGTIDGKRGEKRRGNCSYLFQEAKLLPNLTVEENLKFVLPETEWEKISGALERVGLGGREKSYPKSLSGGERQRVSVLRAFLYPHDVLLMDEPFSSLDLSLKKSLIELVTKLFSDATVVFVTHDVHEAVLLAKRAIVLKKGRIMEDIPIDTPYPRDFFQRYPEEELLVRALMENQASL